MTKDKAMSGFLAGELLCIGEYRMSEASIVDYRDKTTGKPASFPSIKHTVEFGRRSVTVQDRAPEGFRVEGFVEPFKKGQHVICHVSDWFLEKGNVTCRGKLEQLDSEVNLSSAGSVSGKSSGVR